MSWTEVIKASHPGSLGHLSSQQRARLEAAVVEFLETKLPPEDVVKCKALIVKTNKLIPAMPEDLIDDFGDWMDEQMDAGMLNKDSIAAWKKAQETGVAKSPMKKKETGRGPLSAQKPSKPAESSSSSRRKSAPVSRESDNKPGWTAWPVLIRERLPELPLDKPQFSLFVKAYLNKEKIDEVKVYAPGLLTSKVSAIPDASCTDFVEKFIEKFKYLEQVKVILNSPKKSSAIVPEKRGLEEEAEGDDAEEAARKLQRKEAKNVAIHKSNLALYNKWVF